MIVTISRGASRLLGGSRRRERQTAVESLEVRRLLTALTVTTSSDAASHSGTSLRDAVIIANADSRAGKSDSITFASGLNGQTIALSQGNLELGLGGAGSGLIAISASIRIAISGNHASRVFFVDPGVHATFTGLTITAGGSAASITNGAGIFSQGTTTISNCSFIGNSSTLNTGTGGGAVENFNATMTINNSTFFGNSSSQGGAIYNHGVLTINDSTFSGNSAGFGGAINNFRTGSLTLQSSIVAGNIASGGGTTVVVSTDIDGSVQAASSFNLIGDGSGMTGISNGVAGNKIGQSASLINPKLAPLTYYGGTTPTMALFAGSPAINTGGAQAGVKFPKDQNGRSRVGTADIGAYEATSAVNFGSQVVTTTSDDALHTGVSLRDAVGRAQVDASNGRSDTVAFTASLNGKTITLAQGQLELGGVGSGVTTINSNKQIITLSGNEITRVFLVDAGVHAAFTGLTIREGGGANGGAIFSYGTTTITNCTFVQNATSYGSNTGGGAVENFNATMTITNSAFTSNLCSQGGAIYNHGVLTVGGSTFTENKAVYGGAIYNFSTLTVSASTFTNNGAESFGGGINNTGTMTVSSSKFLGNTTKTLAERGSGMNNTGTATIIDSTFSNNEAPDSGGGIENSGVMSIIGSTFSANSAHDADGGAIDNLGTLLVNTCTFSANTANTSRGNGGGINNQGLLTVSRSTFSGNVAFNGGGIYNNIVAAVNNSTFFKNQGFSGGAFFNTMAGRLAFANATISGNSASSGGGISNNKGILMLLSTIVAGNGTAVNTSPDILGPVQASSTFNLIGNGFGMTGITDGKAGNKVGTSAKPKAAGLLPPALNGGTTPTMALTAGSLVRNAAGQLTSLAAAITSKTTRRIFVGLTSFIAPTSNNSPISFIIRIDNEQMLVTSAGGDNTSLVIDRGYNGTTAATHAVGAKVYLATDQRGKTRDNAPDIGAFEFVPT